MQYLPIRAGLLVAILLLAATPSLAQAGAQQPPAPEPREEAMRDVEFEQGSEAMQRTLDRLIGSHSNGEHSVHIARVHSPAMPFALYVEVSRRGHEVRPDRQQVWWLSETPDGIKARVNIFPPRNEFHLGTNSADLAVGMWAAPDMFPLLKTTGYVTLGDLTTRWEGDTLHLESEYPHAIAFGGALYSDTHHLVTAESFAWRETGTDANGAVVWGESPVEMTRLESTPMAVELPSGVRYIDLREGTGEVIVEGVSVAMHLESYTPTGLLLETTRMPPFKIFVNRVENLPNLGVRQGAMGMKAPFRVRDEEPFSGGVRRVIVPPALGFPRGFPPVLKPDQVLIYNLMLDSINPQPGVPEANN
ncbi:MAG: FKBP-type peptidyl-prolyl cis-trans isomerase [Phycisphaerales bacterium JB043]